MTSPTDLPDLSLPTEKALVAARERGAVDGPLLAVLRHEVLVCGVEEVDGAPRPAVRQFGEVPAMLAWTTTARAAAAGWTSGVAEQPGQEIARLLHGHGLGLAINPGDEVGVLLGPDAVHALLGPQDVELPAGATIYVGTPADPHTELVQQLTSALSGLPLVEQARLAQVQVEGGDLPPHPMLVISLADAADESYRKMVLAVAGDLLNGYRETVEVLLVAEGTAGPATSVEPFYLRP